MSNPLENDEGKGRLSDDDVARLTGHIADLTSAGLPLAPGLRATSEEISRGRLRSALRSIADALDRGASVDEALASQGKRLPGHLRGLIAVGARTGKISQVLGRFIAFSHVGSELRRNLLISLAYPALSLVIATAILTFVCSALIPSFEAIFKDFGISLPVLTVIVLNVSHVFAVSWPWVGEFLIAVFVLWLAFFVLLGVPARRSLLGGLPIVGVVWRNSGMAEFCHLLAMLLESGVPLGEALRLTGEGVRDSSIDRACVGMARDVEGGLTLSQALMRRSFFPKGLGRVLRWAEGNQSLPDALQMAGEMFESGARVQSGLAGTILAVIVVLSILVGIAGVVVGLFLPLITLISKLSG
ncbi:MAG: type II secretion system F family protein [Planctomycetia bacterium]|nr:type II secretion system F family protein [Planctomycetia bacterium]